MTNVSQSTDARIRILEANLSVENVDKVVTSGNVVANENNGIYTITVDDVVATENSLLILTQSLKGLFIKAGTGYVLPATKSNNNLKGFKYGYLGKEYIVDNDFLPQIYYNPSLLGLVATKFYMEATVSPNITLKKLEVYNLLAQPLNPDLAFYQFFDKTELESNNLLKLNQNILAKKVNKSFTFKIAVSYSGGKESELALQMVKDNNVLEQFSVSQSDETRVGDPENQVFEITHHYQFDGNGNLTPLSYDGFGFIVRNRGDVEITLQKINYKIIGG